MPDDLFPSPVQEGPRCFVFIVPRIPPTIFMWSDEMHPLLGWREQLAMP